MGKRGPAPKPTQLKLLQGNAGKRKLNDQEPEPPVLEVIPDPPEFLSTLAKKEWSRVAPILVKTKILTDADIMSLAAYCQNYDRWIHAEKAIRANGLTVMTDKGNIIQNPEVGIANTAMKLLKDFAKEFGLTPSSRSNLRVDKAEEEVDPAAKFIGGRKYG